MNKERETKEDKRAAPRKRGRKEKKGEEYPDEAAKGRPNESSGH